MYRAYHAIRGLSGPDGRSTNAVYGFVTMLRKLLADHQPTYIAASFDLAGPTFRDPLAADYKANRTAMPDDLAEQIPWVHEACEALGVPIITQAGFEADDVIGTLARRAVEGGDHVAVVTGDKDFFQLVDEHIRVFNPRDEGTWYDQDGVIAKWGVRPEQVVDVLALMGDSIDNIKGVPGIGEKGAQGSHRDVGLARRAARARRRGAAAEVSRGAARARRGRAPQPRAAADPDGRLRPVRARAVPLPRRVPGAVLRAVLALAVPLAGDGIRADGGCRRDAVRSGHDRGAAGGARRGDPRCVAIGDARAARRTHSWPALASQVWPSRSARAAAWYVPLQQGTLLGEPGLGQREVLPALAPLLEDERLPKVGHDLKADAFVLARHGVALKGLAFDTMIASYLLDPTRSAHGLEDTALEHLGYKALTRRGRLRARRQGGHAGSAARSPRF